MEITYNGCWKVLLESDLTESAFMNLPLKTLKPVPPLPHLIPVVGHLSPLRSHSLCDLTAANSTWPRDGLSYPSILGQLSKGIHRLKRHTYSVLSPDTWGRPNSGMPGWDTCTRQVEKDWERNSEKQISWESPDQFLGQQEKPSNALWEDSWLGPVQKVSAQSYTQGKCEA